MNTLNEACLRMNTFISNLSKCRHEAFILHSCLFFRLKSYAVHSQNSVRMYLLFLSDSLSLILSQRTDSKLRSLVIWSGQFTSKYFSLFIYNVRVIIVSVSSGSLRALWVSTYNMPRGVTDRVTGLLAVPCHHTKLMLQPHVCVDSSWHPALLFLILWPTVLRAKALLARITGLSIPSLSFHSAPFYSCRRD